MADFWNTDTGEAVFRSRDAVKNLRIKVRVERVTSTAALSQHLQQQILSQQDGGDIELETLTPQSQTGDNEEELVVGWQEKLFSQYEMELFQNEAACQTPLDRQYHTEIKALNRAKGRRNNRIFTYTDHDRYTNCLPFHQLVSYAASYNVKSKFSRSQLDSSIPKSKIINWEPTEEFVRKQIVTDGEKREVWRLYVENVSTTMKPEETEREQNMYKDLYVRHKEYLNSLVGQDFEMPPVGVLRYMMNGEIVSAKGFEYDNLYIHFFMELPQQLVQSAISVSLRGYPDLPDQNIREESVPQWPVLYFKVLSLDSWQRYRTEGYGYLLFPAMPELEDHSYVRIPGTFKGERLSRFGFCTETTGSVTFNLHCIQQARAFIDAAMLKKRRQKVFDQLGGFSQQGAVCTILEAFQRARRKMKEARETLPRDIINTTAQLQTESSA
ncbi:Meckel syndrome type 1 protein -like protein [Collichthys lucidus]|uniref:Meckel syndrome type 1 protein-like protein n=1 Tax=Collichthys lucidus TaxID=240159 RepID=A0A4U5V5Y3_COLLU|nr:Meckel syndrome type 1 protein -like protein [Collichthys lucidus]